METVTRIASLRKQIKQWRECGQTIAFVPTMGNLHAGHIALVQNARQHADRVVVSIFVNPTQFGPNEDFASYPRTEQQDQQKLTASGVDLLFLPSVEEMYPNNLLTRVSVNGLSDLHCGTCRPGHFDGVALVVCKLLNIVQPDLLFMGEKDYQQLAIIRTLVADLNIPTQIHGIATIREADGLAMSSRNGYLNAFERQTAPKLYKSLCAVREGILAGNQNYLELVNQQSKLLEQAGFTLDYFQVCRSTDLLPAATEDTQLVVLIAAKLGKTRLIDNIHFIR